MSVKKPLPDADVDPKTRTCLACRGSFRSQWAGERICQKCKSSSSWRSGTVNPYTAFRRR